MFHLLDIIGTIAFLKLFGGIDKKWMVWHIYSCFRDGCRRRNLRDVMIGTTPVDARFRVCLYISLVFCIVQEKSSTDCGPRSFYLILSG
jgi:hypothetical protein